MDVHGVWFLPVNAAIGNPTPAKFTTTRFFSGGSMRKIAGSVVTLVFVVIFLVKLFGQPYGKELKFKAGQLYFLPPVTEAEANKLGEHLVKAEFFDDTPKSVQLTKESGYYAFHMVVKQEYQRNQEFHNGCVQMAWELSREVFNGERVDFHMCDDRLKTISEIVFTSPGKALKFKAALLYYLDPATEAEAKKLGEYLVKDGLFADTPLTVQLKKADNRYQFRMIVKKGYEDDADFLKSAERMTGQLSHHVFDNAPVDFYICNGVLEMVKLVHFAPPKGDSATPRSGVGPSPRTVLPNQDDKEKINTLPPRPGYRALAEGQDARAVLSQPSPRRLDEIVPVPRAVLPEDPRSVGRSLREQGPARALVSVEVDKTDKINRLKEEKLESRSLLGAPAIRVRWAEDAPGSKERSGLDSSRRSR